MSSPRRTPQFRRDLSNAWLYIAERSVERADAFVEAVGETIELLIASPGIGRPRPEFDEPGIRSFRTAARYVIYYVPQEDGGIELLRLYHSSRDPNGVF